MLQQFVAKNKPVCNFPPPECSLFNKEFLKFDEKELIRKCLRGEPRAQESLYHQFASKMMGVVYRYAGNGDDAKDILQEGFIKVFRFLHTFKSEGSLEGWVKRIMVNVAIDHCKKNVRYRNEVELKDEIDFSDAEYEVLYKLEQEHIMCLINALPEGFKLIFNMYAIEGFSHKEIALQLNISESTVRTQYIRAKKRLLDSILVKNGLERSR